MMTRADAVISIIEPLYRDHPHWAEERERLSRVLDHAAASRSGALCALDAERASNPRWFGAPHMIGYSFYVDRYAGDLKGLRNRLGWLDDLGIRLLHPLPMTLPQSGDSDGGFAVADYRAIDPKLGDVDDVRALAADLHDRGMALTMDCVLNHCARDHAWAQAALAGDTDKRDYFRTFADKADVDAWEAVLDQVFPDTAPGNFTYEATLDRYVWTTFYPFQWDLDWSNPAVFREMLDVLLFWANVGVDAFRLDSAPYLWKREGTHSRNLPETHQLVAGLRAGLDTVAPGVALLAEAIEHTREVLPYLEPQDGSRACQIAYHNGAMAGLWTALGTGDPTPLVTVLDQTRLHRADTAWLTYLRCHDDIIWTSLTGIVPDDVLRRCSAFFAGEDGSYARGLSFQARADAPVSTVGMMASLLGGDGDDARARYRLMLGVLLALPGMPMLYMGDEIGEPNDEKGAQALDVRWLHRPVMDWVRADAAARGEGPGAPFLRITRDLLARRATCEAFASSAPAKATVEEGALTIDRGAVLVLANFTGQDLPTGQTGELMDLLSGFPVGDTLPPYGVMWLKRRD